MEGLCYIFGASPQGYIPCEVNTPGFVIAADAGYIYAHNLGLEIDLCVGDFDSLGFVPDCTEVIKHPSIKDDTDMLLAIKQGLMRGYKTFVIFAADGGRPDHEIANIQSLAYLAQHGARGFIIGKQLTVTAIMNGALHFSSDYRGNISVFALCGEAKGVCLEGLKYPLFNATLDGTFPLGVSNEFTGKPATVSVDDGILTVMWSGNNPSLPE